MVRKFRNEARLFISTAVTPPVDSIVLAKVIALFGLITIDDLYRNNLSQWVDPLLGYIHDKLDVHKHQ